MTEEGSIEAASVSDIALPDGVREALGRRPDRLSEEANQLLGTAAVVGREFEYETLKLLGEHDEDALLGLLEAGLDARVIEELPRSGRYRFTRALMQETLLAELSTTRRVRLHGQVAEALERQYAERADERAAQLARHYLDSATLNREHAANALRYSRLAAEQAGAQAAWPEAARHCQNCISLIEEAEESFGEDEATLRFALGVSSRHAGDFRTAWRSLMQAVQFYQAQGDGPSVARAALEAIQIHGQPDRQLALLRAALEALAGADPHLEARLLVQMLDAGELGLIVPEAEREAIRERAGELVEAHGFRDVRAGLLAVDAPSWVTAPERIAATRREAHAVLAGEGRIRDAAYATYRVSSAELSAGRLDAADEAAAEAAVYARTNGIRFFEDASTANRAAVLLPRGAFDRFDALVAERESDIANLCFLGTQRTELSGDIDSAEGAIETFAAGGTPMYLSWRHASLARLRMRAGREEGARSHLSEMREALTGVGGNLAGGEISTLVMLDDVLFGLADDAFLDFCSSLLRDAQEGLRIEPISAVPVDRFAGGLMLAVGDVAEAEHRFEAGLELCERERCPVEAGRCLRGLAEVAERRGEREQAMEHLDRAGELFSRHGARLYLDQVLAKKEILRA